MSMQVDEHDFDGFCQSSSLRGSGGPYEPSIASSASSSQSSVFSESSSVQSSIASSISDDFRHNYDQARDSAVAQAQIRRQTSCDGYTTVSNAAKAGNILKAECHAPSYADVTSVPKEQRQHPRRNSLARSNRPPTLQRQCDRKFNFVESLVGKQLNPQ